MNPAIRISAKEALEHQWFVESECKVHGTKVAESQKKFMLDSLTHLRDKNKLRRIVLSYLSSQ